MELKNRKEGNHKAGGPHDTEEDLEEISIKDPLSKKVMRICHFGNTKFVIALIVWRFLYMIFVTKQHSLFADEYNQLTEVVYHLVYGKTLLSFEWIEGLRGLLLIEVYAWPLRILSFLGLDFLFLVRYNTYVLHIAYLLFGDYFFI